MDQLVLAPQSLAKEVTSIETCAYNVHHSDKIPQVQLVTQKTEASTRYGMAVQILLKMSLSYENQLFELLNPFTIFF